MKTNINYLKCQVKFTRIVNFFYITECGQNSFRVRPFIARIETTTINKYC